MTNFNTNFLNATPFSDQTVQLALAATTALNYTVPGTSSIQYRIEFSWPYDANVYVGYRITATLPTAGTLTSNNSIEFRPDVRYVRGGDTLSFISTALVANAGFRLLKVPS